MMLDYPQIVSQLNLLLGAGMSSKSAWKKIVDDYQQRRQTSGTRAAYEEMCAAWNEMCGGVPEKECYEKLRQQVRPAGVHEAGGASVPEPAQRGRRGWRDALRLEGIHAFEERKAPGEAPGGRRRGQSCSCLCSSCWRWCLSS